MTQISADIMPFAKLMGVELVETTKEKIVGRLLVRPDLCTAGGIAHGGALMAFADSLGAVGAFLTLPEGASATTTIESKTNFLGAAKAGVVLIGEATPVHSGRRTGVWQTRISREDGVLVALVIQTQMVLGAN